MRVCYFGTYRANYSRNCIMIEGLRRSGVEVIECHEDLWYGIEDRVEIASGGWLSLRFFWRLLRAYIRLILAHRKVGAYDVMVVGYPGQLDVYLARLLSWVRGKPLVWDVFMSIYLIALERELDQRSCLSTKLLSALERWACRLPERLILDTTDYVQWFNCIHGVSAERFRLVPTGADDRLFHAGAERGSRKPGFNLVYYGTFIPNHGVPVIVEAAHLLRDEAEIHIDLIGEGPTRDVCATLIERYQLDNVALIGWLDPDALVSRIARADVCLGVFGSTPQSLMTVQNKLYECLAMGKPVITGIGPAVSRVFVHRKHVFFCERQDSVSLASAMRELKANATLRTQLRENGKNLYFSHFDLPHNGERYRVHLEELLV